MTGGTFHGDPPAGPEPAPTYEDLQGMVSTISTIAASEPPHRKAIMCPGCARLHYGPGAYCSASCEERVRREVHAYIRAEFPIVDPSPGLLSLDGVMRGLANVISERLVTLIFPMVLADRAWRRHAGYRYWRKRARKERLGFGVPLMAAGGGRLSNRPED